MVLLFLLDGLNLSDGNSLNVNSSSSMIDNPAARTQKGEVRSMALIKVGVKCVTIISQPALMSAKCQLKQQLHTQDNLMSKMAPLLGSEVTEMMFVPRFTALCSHNGVAIRNTCATNFGDFCAVVSRQVTETQLLPRFCELARDSDWLVRKACAEVIMSVSCACCLQTRKAVLAQVFDNLLADVMRWVRISAFQTLGPFITTFAEPSITGLAYNQQGELVLTNPEGFEFRFGNQQNDYPLTKPELYEELATLIGEKKESRKEELKSEEKTKSECQPAVDCQFDSFLYWREPIPEIDSDLTICDLANVEENQCNVDSGHPTETESTTSSQHSEPPLLCAHLASRQTNLKVGVGEWWNPEPPQDIVPQPLIDHFVSMSDPSNASSTDIDMAHHCAFSLPAVALTLGPKHWDLLRDTYSTLASDRQWKVRRTVASSIHELAVILGEDMATQDLVPIFSGLIKDLDEVRIGALRHLSYFLRLLRPSGRNHFLPRLADFLKTEYDYNWRFRDELARQLMSAMPLYSPSDTCVHLTPIGIALMLDNVAAVRESALNLVTELVKHVSVEISLLRGLLAELAEQFAHSARWNRRQTFALLCSKLIYCRALVDDMFARDVLPHLLDLSWDPVPNVRLAVARTVNSDIMNNQYFCNEQNPHHEVLMQALRRLQNDKDRDVRYFAVYKTIRSEEEVKNGATCYTAV
ncbi:Serine/threonine-protein phosphatase 4 regulatory subunit 1 [Homalodisca vitripennis]|nr:Serine/threonine-protein phosphatase 4 regulatory subunit 1 [Homalodisca vitripennis]